MCTFIFHFEWKFSPLHASHKWGVILRNLSTWNIWLWCMQKFHCERRLIKSNFITFSSCIIIKSSASVKMKLFNFFLYDVDDTRNSINFLRRHHILNIIANVIIDKNELKNFSFLSTENHLETMLKINS